jgi:outer membrane protein assembly factor BamB
MRLLAVSVVLASALAGAGCTSTSGPPYSSDGCAGRSRLLSLEASTGDVAWSARLSQTSELPLRVDHGAVLVSGPCGAAVVRLDSGDVRFDDAIGPDVIGVLGDEVLRRGSTASDGTASVLGTDLDTGTGGSSYSSNTPFHDAVVIDRRLVTLYGDQLTASSRIGSRSDWWVQIPVYRTPRLTPAGDLVLVTGGDGSTFAVDLSDGTLRWRTVPPVASTAYDLAVTPVPGTVLTAATTYDDHPRHLVYATDSGAGGLRWSRGALGVVAADRELTVLRTAHAFEAVGTLDGRLRWSRPAPRIRYLSDLLPGEIAPGAVVVRPRYDAVVGLDRSTGRSRWRVAEASPSLTVVGHVAVVQTYRDRSGEGERMLGIDAATGARLWQRPVDQPTLEMAAAPGGTVLVLDGDPVPHFGN